jgi:ADP-ribose pyrophosphatase YjhB (NUDIX family)
MKAGKIASKSHALLACALIQDGGRYLFIASPGRDGREELALPCALVEKGADPVAGLSAAVREQAGIDAHVEEPVLQGRFNAGSRKNRAMIPAIAFAVTSKSLRARTGDSAKRAEWLKAEDALKRRLARNSEWLRSCVKAR